MNRRGQAALAILGAVAVLGGPGCVTKRQFRDNVAATDTRVSAVEDGVEANEKRLSDLKTDTDSKVSAVDQKAGKALETGTQAMSKAENAEKLAKGKILWQVSVSDDKSKFENNKSTLSTDTTSVLDELATRVKGYGKAVFLEIEGHTDSNGSESYNLKLGEQRAMAVRNYLSQKGGLPLHAMNTISYGESQPVADNSTKDGRAQNRRVVIKVLE